MRIFGALAVAEWYGLRRRLAVRAVSTSEGLCGAMPQLQPGWELLSAGSESGERASRGCEYRNEWGSIARQNTVRNCVFALSSPPFGSKAFNRKVRQGF